MLVAAPASADTVKLRGKEAFREVEVLNYRDGLLTFRGLTRQDLRKPLHEVEFLIIDRYPAFANGERLAAVGEWDAAARSYQLALTDVPETWLQEWIEVRLLQAFDGCGHFDVAVGRYIELAQNRLDWETLPVPRGAGAPGSAVNASARKIVEAALAGALPRGLRARLTGFLLEMVLLDDVDPLPAALKLPADVLLSRSRPEDAGAPQKRTRRYGLLPERVATVERDLPLIPADSFLLDFAARHLTDPDDAATINAFRRLREAIPFLTATDLARANLLFGRHELRQGSPEAALEYFAAAANSELSGAIACEARYYAGLAHERTDQFVEAEAAFARVASDAGCAADLREQARAARERVSRRLAPPQP